MNKHPRIILKSNKNGTRRFWFTVQCANGKTVVTSETYKQKHHAIVGINALVIAVAGLGGRYEDRT